MELFITLVVSCGLMSLTTTGYGIVVRGSQPAWLQQISLGAFFGIGAMASMLDPFTISPGIIVDGRSLFTGLAAGFLGPVGALVTLLIGVTTRVLIGGGGMEIGVIGLCCVAALGMLWKRFIPRFAMPRLAELLVLGLSLCLALSLFAFIPEAFLSQALKTLPYLATYLIFGSLVFGVLLDREHRRYLHEADLAQAVITDPLTGLYNRRRLRPEYDKAVSISHRGDMAVQAIDVDRFKLVNDSFGHEAGDKALIKVAQVLRNNLRNDDALLRVGGEEFLLIVPATELLDVERLAWRTVQSLRLSMQMPEGQFIEVTSSVGAVHFSSGNVTLEAAQNAADEALYEAKNSGRDKAVVKRLTAPSFAQNVIELAAG